MFKNLFLWDFKNGNDFSGDLCFSSGGKFRGSFFTWDTFGTKNPVGVGVPPGLWHRVSDTGVFLLYGCHYIIFSKRWETTKLCFVIHYSETTLDIHQTPLYCPVDSAVCPELTFLRRLHWEKSLNISMYWQGFNTLKIVLLLSDEVFRNAVSSAIQ